MPKFIDLTGRKFARLTVVEHAGRVGAKNMWRCRCDCGNETLLCAHDINAERIKSCGCLQREAAQLAGYRHGGWGTREYRIWWAIKTRCFNKGHSKFELYGGRGITMCTEWKGSFVAFLRDMGPCPSPHHSIDRIDNDGNYEPGNCRWATQREQLRNRSNNHLVTHDGLTLTLVEWAERTGLPASRIGYRLNHGWSTTRALTIPLKT